MTARVPAIISVWVAAVLVGCTSTPPAWHVRVVDDATDQPLAGVTIASWAQSGDSRGDEILPGRTTDTDGRFTLAVPPTDQARRVTVSKTGYAPAELLWDEDAAGEVRVVSPALADSFGLMPRQPQDGRWPAAELVPVRLVPDPDHVVARPGNRIAP